MYTIADPESLCRQLNIFLAILINGYAAMQAEDEDSKMAGILTEVCQIIAHDARRVIKHFWKGYRFISNAELVALLSTEADEDPLDEALEAYHHVKVSALMEIRCRSGARLKIRDVHRVLRAFGAPNQCFASSSHAHSMELYLDPLLRGVMKRFGRVPEQPRQGVLREKTEAFQRRMELEAMRHAALAELRALGGSTADSGTGPEGAATGGGPAGHCTLSVVIHAMRNLPSMDVFRGCDACCRIFLEGSPGLFQTEVRRGVSEADWAWDAALSDGFRWDLPMDPEHLLPDRKLVVLVFDKDQLSKDDLVGCVAVSLRELVPAGALRGWRRIARPPERSLFFWHRPTVGEVLLSVTLAPKAPRQEGGGGGGGVGGSEREDSDADLSPAQQAFGQDPAGGAPPKLAHAGLRGQFPLAVSSSLGFPVGRSSPRPLTSPPDSSGPGADLEPICFLMRPTPPPPAALLLPSPDRTSGAPDAPTASDSDGSAWEGSAEAAAAAVEMRAQRRRRALTARVDAGARSQSESRASTTVGAAGRPSAPPCAAPPAPTALRAAAPVSSCPWPCSPEFVVRRGPDL